MRCFALAFCFIASLCYLLDMSSQKSELLLLFCGSSNEKFVMLLLERSNCMRLGISRAMPLSTSVMWLLERLRHFRFVRLVRFNLTTLATQPSVNARDSRFDNPNRSTFSSSMVASMMCNLVKFVLWCKTAEGNKNLSVMRVPVHGIACSTLDPLTQTWNNIFFRDKRPNNNEGVTYQK